MAEGDVSYASVVFKANKQPRQEAQKEEETVYDEVKGGNQTTEQNPQTNAGLLPDKKADSKHRCYRQLACGLGTLCVILLLGIIAVVTYISTYSNVSDVSQLNQTALMAVNRNLTEMNSKLSSDNENLRRDHNNLAVRFDNLTQAYAVLESNITSLTAENGNFRMKNEELSTQNQELQTDKKNLTEQIQNMETNWNKLNTSRAQWSIDAYCPKNKEKRQCEPCQKGWDVFESNCYASNNPKKYDDLKTWKEAQENCRGKNSDLVVVVTEAEKIFVSSISWPGTYPQYWIGLIAEDGKWKWVDGTDLTDNSWIQQPAPEGSCAVSVYYQGWKAVSCDQKNRWICQKKALSV